MSVTEIAAFVLSVIYVWFNARQSIWCWPFGAASVILLGWVVLQANLYADFILQVIYLGFSIYGWISWKQMHDNKQPQILRKLNITLALYIAGVTSLMYLGTFAVLSYFPTASMPTWDGLGFALSLAATWMNARKYIENWFVWIVANTLYAAIYFYKDLYLLSGLSLFLAIMSAWSWLQWLKGKRLNESVPPLA